LAIGAALSVAAILLLPTDRCEFIVLGEPEPQTELLRLVDLYRADAVPASELAELTVAESDAFIQRLQTVRKMIRQGGAGLTVEPDDTCIQAAALLVTEHAMTFAAKSRWEAADARFDAAWRISHVIYARARLLQFQRDWLLTVGLFHHQIIFAYAGDEGGFERADRFLHNAVRRYPDDPEVLLASGSLLEWAGSLRFGNAAHLKEAEELYARARRLAPLDPDVLLRHGKVLERLERDAEARGPLLQVLELPAKADLQYRSRMALGGLSERAGDLDDAIKQYEAAAASIGSWQVAHVALAHALHLTGAHDRAREILDEALAMTPEESDEAHGGWWSYELGISLRFGPLLDRMRAEVRR
jgi:tetratricopeptide (TPR) repeat protein